MNIKKSLTHYMKLNDYTQADVSRLAILNPATVSLVINGHRNPTCETIQKLSDLFEVKVSEFIAAGELGIRIEVRVAEFLAAGE